MASRAKVVWGQAMTAKTKEPLTTKQKAQIATLSAGGLSQNKIAKHIGRSRHAVKNTLALPEIQHAVQDEKAELSALYKDAARRVRVSISDSDIEKANLLQKATSSAIMIDKSMLLTRASGRCGQFSISSRGDRRSMRPSCPSPKCSRPSFSPPYDMTRVSGTSSLLTVRTL